MDNLGKQQREELKLSTRTKSYTCIFAFSHKPVQSFFFSLMFFLPSLWVLYFKNLRKWRCSEDGKRRFVQFLISDFFTLQNEVTSSYKNMNLSLSFHKTFVLRFRFRCLSSRSIWRAKSDHKWNFQILLWGENRPSNLKEDYLNKTLWFGKDYNLFINSEILLEILFP